MASTPEQQHEHETTDQLRDDLEYYRERAVQLEDIVTGVRAVVNVGRPDWRRRCENAAAALRGLLATPNARPGAWESQHIEALSGPRAPWPNSTRPAILAALSRSTAASRHPDT